MTAKIESAEEFERALTNALWWNRQGMIEARDEQIRAEVREAAGEISARFYEAGKVEGLREAADICQRVRQPIADSCARLIRAEIERRER